MQGNSGTGQGSVGNATQHPQEVHTVWYHRRADRVMARRADSFCTCLAVSQYSKHKKASEEHEAGIYLKAGFRCAAAAVEVIRQAGWHVRLRSQVQQPSALGVCCVSSPVSARCSPGRWLWK
jgi:hypothetical protein